MGAVFEATNRCLVSRVIDIDDHVSHDGRVLEVLSDHNYLPPDANCRSGWSTSSTLCAFVRVTGTRMG
ncbi:MAG TPA: hypothetical protein VGD78_16425 [Chthoniobacterales bacterium]